MLFSIPEASLPIVDCNNTLVGKINGLLTVTIFVPTP